LDGPQGERKEAWPFCPPLDEGEYGYFGCLSGFLEAGLSMPVYYI